VLGTSRTVADLLGIAAVRAALHAIERGELAADTYATVGDDWDVEERARAWLDRLGLVHLALDGGVGQLSGGETVLVALAALLLRRPASSSRRWTDTEGRCSWPAMTCSFFALRGSAGGLAGPDGRACGGRAFVLARVAGVG
jgi:hypothetical protein